MKVLKKRKGASKVMMRNSRFFSYGHGTKNMRTCTKKKHTTQKNEITF